MAKCKRIEPKEPEYVLELTAREAGVLLSLIGSMAGPPDGFNQDLDVIYDALDGAGVQNARCKLELDPELNGFCLKDAS